MKSFVSFFALLTGLLTVSCLSGYSTSQLKALESRADAGDFEAARQLADYYNTVKMPLSPLEYKRLSEKSEPTPREAKKLQEYRMIEERYAKWAGLAEDNSKSESTLESALTRDDLKRLVKEMVSIMKQEKINGSLEDSPYGVFLVDSMGFSQESENETVFSKGTAIRVSLLRRQENFSRQLIIETDSDSIWIMVVALQEYGFKHERGEGTRLRGDGITVLANKDRLVITY